MTQYTVRVGDNYHYQDPDEIWTLGVFDTYGEALAQSKALVDTFLDETYRQGMSAETLYGQYRMFGDDPYVPSPDGEPNFSAWDYARERCAEIVEERSAEKADGPSGPVD